MNRRSRQTGEWLPFAEYASARVGSEQAIMGCIAALLRGSGRRLTAAESVLIRNARAADSALVGRVRDEILAGRDPLGDAFCRVRPIAVRRTCGAVYTPSTIVQSMIEWASRRGDPRRVVDPGCGSGRFLLAAATRFPGAELVGVDTDPLAALVLRANASVLGFEDRVSVHVCDYRDLALGCADGPTLFIGNPPYVRHHDLSESSKSWYGRTAGRLGLKASKLAGLHVHFFLKTRALAQPGDYGAFITSAEWLDVNYGSIVRSLLEDGLGGVAIHVLAPQALPFADAATTAAVTCFQVGGGQTGIRLRHVGSLARLGALPDRSGVRVPWTRLRTLTKWSAALRGERHGGRELTRLGDLFRVHRGQATGANSVWVAGGYPGWLPAQVLVPAITRARELIECGECLRDATRLRRVIDLPPDLSGLDADARADVERFLRWARAQGAHESYIARHRSPWWSVKLRAPAPILCTYMARRAPVFVRNRCGARHLNIAHGLYPRQALPEALLIAAVRYLRENVRREYGRTYAGGLTKFEPRELEALPFLSLQQLHAMAENLVDPGA